MKRLFVYLFLLFNLNAFSQITVSLSATTYPVNPSLLGLNGRSTEGPSWTDSNFLSLVAEMNPSYIRYPAGTQGNLWDWSTGTFIPGQGSSKFIFTIPMLVNGLPPSTKIIYMVNMVLPTPATGINFSTTTDAVLATDATLNAEITDILNALNAFQTAGHLPEVCELGNELYFSSMESSGVYAGNSTLYLQHAKTIAYAIKNKFPGIKIILCTTKGGTTSRDNWNNAVFSALSTDSQFRAAIYGVVQHHYINGSYGYTGTVTDLTSAKTIIDEGITYVQESIPDYNVVPSSMKLWITEYGATKTSADGMWAAGLRTATMTLSFMQLGSKLENLMWHHVTDAPNVLSADKTSLGPSGIAFSMLTEAMNNKTSYKKLVFSNMSSSNVYAGLTGYKFIADDEENILILNTENVTYSNVNLSGLTASGTIQFARQYWSQTPYLKNVTPTSNISVNTSTTLNTYQINPFSITVISKKLNTADLGIQTDNTIKVYPAIFENEITVNSQNEATYSIKDLLGRTVLTGKLNNGINKISTEKLEKGLNIIYVNNRIFKVIKK